MKDNQMKEIIKFAEKKGYTGHLKYLPLVLPRVHLDPFFLLEGHQADIFFDHDFLKAVFGAKNHKKNCETCVTAADILYRWECHAQELALIFPDKRKEYIHNYIREVDGEEAGETRKDS